MKLFEFVLVSERRMSMTKMSHSCPSMPAVPLTRTSIPALLLPLSRKEMTHHSRLVLFIQKDEEEKRHDIPAVTLANHGSLGALESRRG